jgi:hypothetical protein
MGDGTMDELELEEARERHFWGRFLRVLWTALILLLVLAVLSSLTLLLGWLQYLLLCVVGLLTGISLVVAVRGSALNRGLVGLILGAITLPLLAAYLSSVAGTGQVAFSAYSASFFPFLVHATGAMLAGLWIVRVWRSPPRPPQPDGHDEGRHSGGAVP